MQTAVHLLSGDETEQQTALAIARNLVADETDSIDDVAVVVQAGAISVVEAGAESEDKVQALLDDDVSFKACRNSLETVEFGEDDLVEGIEVVPEGAVEITRLQTEGYAYVRP